MPQMIDLTGRIFGKLKVVKYIKPVVYPSTTVHLWKCRCVCGDFTEVSSSNLRGKNPVIGCGCGGIGRQKHRATGTPTYNSWSHMMRRCYKSTAHNYHHYGGRGITVCKRWHKFENFLKDMGERPNGMTLDRYPNNNGNYRPGNCRWATQTQQVRNRR